MIPTTRKNKNYKIFKFSDKIGFFFNKSDKNPTKSIRLPKKKPTSLLHDADRTSYMIYCRAYNM